MAQQLTGIHHIQLAMPPGEEDAGRRFYGDLLGLTEIPKPSELAPRGGIWFRSGELEVHLGVERQDFRPATKAHPAFLVRRLESSAGAFRAGGLPDRRGCAVRRVPAVPCPRSVRQPAEQSSRRDGPPVRACDPAASLPRASASRATRASTCARRRRRGRPGGAGDGPDRARGGDPDGPAGLVLPRSGLASKQGLTLSNAPGLIDAGYRGEVICAVVNLDPGAREDRAGDRIAQLVIVELPAVSPAWVDESCRRRRAARAGSGRRARRSGARPAGGASRPGGRAPGRAARVRLRRGAGDRRGGARRRGLVRARRRGRRRVVGHVQFSRAWIGETALLALGPVGVLPERQGGASGRS